jgi:hypothetical protein
MHREPGGPATSYTDPMSWDSHLTYDRCVRINRGGVYVSIGGVYMYHEGVCAYQSPIYKGVGYMESLNVNDGASILHLWH